MESADTLKGPERINARLPVSFRSGDVVIAAETTEVSLRGVFVATDEPLRERKLVHLTIDLPQGEAIETHGMVERSVNVDTDGPHEEQPGMAVRFYGLGIRAQELWETFLRAAPSDPIEQEPSMEASLEVSAASESVLVDESYLSSVERAKAIAAEPTKLLDQQRVDTASDAHGSAGHAPSGPRGHTVLCLKLPTTESLDEFRRTALAAGGVNVRTSARQVPGRTVVLRVIHPETGHEFHIPGQVAKATSDFEGVTVTFCEVTDHTLQAFSAFTKGAISAVIEELRETSELSLADTTPIRHVCDSEWSIENTFEVSKDDLDPLASCR